MTRDALIEVSKELARVAVIRGNERATGITSARKWVELLLRRHGDLAPRIPERLSIASVTLTENGVRQISLPTDHPLVAERVSDIWDDPERVSNLDDTAMRLKPSHRGGASFKDEPRMSALARHQEILVPGILEFNILASEIDFRHSVAVWQHLTPIRAIPDPTMPLQGRW